MNEKVLNEARELISGFLKQRRVELGYSQEYIAEQVGCNRSTIIRFENGHFWPRFEQYLRLCEALHLFPTVIEMESDTTIAKALRDNWKPKPKAMTVEEALKLKGNRHKRPSDEN